MTDAELIKNYKLVVKEDRSPLRICPACGGYGHISREDLVDYHKGEYKTSFFPCKTCDTNGLIVEVTREVVAVPVDYYKLSPRTHYEPYDASGFTKERTQKG